MKEEANTTFELSGQQLLEEARNSKSSLLERHPIAGTPFEVVKDPKWFAVLGYNKLTEDFDEMQDVLDWMEENHWELLLRVITMVVQTIDLHKEKVMREAYIKQMDGMNRTEWAQKQAEHSLNLEIEQLKKEQQ